MDKTALVASVAEIFALNRHQVDISVKINHREIDIVAKELQGLIRKTILIECADYKDPVGIDKIQEDERKLQSARQDLKESAVLLHVARNGYTAEALGYALGNGLTILTLENLTRNLINFGPYIEAVEKDRQYDVIVREYQPTTMFLEAGGKRAFPSLRFLEVWLKQDTNFLFVLGDYGVGKSWLLKMLLFTLIEKYKNDPSQSPLPILVPLQKFTKSFDFKNLILKVFDDYGLSGIHYEAFRFLLKAGRVILLLDSFDEMAQNLSRSIIRDNLSTLLEVASDDSKIIMTSRPNYFENKAERVLVVERFDSSRVHKIDSEILEIQEKISSDVYKKMSTAQFARLNDLTTAQRTKLFKTVLIDKPQALSKLLMLLQRFQNLEHLSQRAVIARLLTTVAETLSSDDVVNSVNGVPLLPDDTNIINQAKIFEIVVHNLLARDVGIGDILASDRLRFLKALALHLQGKNADFFASTDEVREIVRSVFANRLKNTDTPEQDLENLYRTCRRHSGLTTEGQFYDTSGVIDLPVSETDIDSRIGFSHNSIREYLVSESLADAFSDSQSAIWSSILACNMTEVIFDFLYDILQYNLTLIEKIRACYLNSMNNRVVERVFEVIYHFIGKSPECLKLLGHPPNFKAVDLSFCRLHNVDVRRALISHCLVQDTDFSNADLRDSLFDGSIIERAKFDNAKLYGADFSKCSISSIYVYDEFDTRTSGVLEGGRARQWLYSRGAIVANPETLNPLMGKPWYEAAREVTRTLQKRLAGTHQQSSLAKGTDVRFREFANDFVKFLMQQNILLKVHKAKGRQEWVVSVNPDHIKEIENFSRGGIIGESLKSFFNRNAPKA